LLNNGLEFRWWQSAGVDAVESIILCQIGYPYLWALRILLLLSILGVNMIYTKDGILDLVSRQCACLVKF
jgi:hypothetical protein